VASASGKCLSIAEAIADPGCAAAMIAGAYSASPQDSGRSPEDFSGIKHLRTKGRTISRPYQLVISCMPARILISIVLFKIKHARRNK
jgi:hypothetical protein